MRTYGITRDPNTMQFMIVFRYAEFGDLRNYLYSKFKNLKWKEKLHMLQTIAADIQRVHKAEFTHQDFHSGNILILQWSNGSEPIIAAVTDLGLSQKIKVDNVEEEKGSGGKTEKKSYGVLPYVSPEVLCGQPYTKAADVYSFGIILAEITTGKPPFNEIPYDSYLAILICNGLRPEFAKGTPQRYVDFAMRCMDADPSKRPDSSEIKKPFAEWYSVFSWSEKKLSEEELAIKEEFEMADKIIPTLSTEINLKTKHISQLLNYSNLPKPISYGKSKLLLFKLYLIALSSF